MERQQQEQAQQGHMDHLMKGGFTMNDIKGLHRFGEDNMDADEGMIHMNASRSQRKGSLGRSSPTFEMIHSMDRSASVLDIDFPVDGPFDDKAEKKRGRSPFKFFKKSRDQSKDKLKSKSPTDRSRGRGFCKPLSFFYTNEFIQKHLVQICYCVYVFVFSCWQKYITANA